MIRLHRLTKVTGMRRICYYGNSSFWTADDTASNRKILEENYILFKVNTFTSAEGTKFSRLEWN